MATWNFARTSLTRPKPLQRVRMTASLHTTQGSQPFNLTARQGSLFTAFVRDGDAWVKHTTQGRPPYLFAGPATATADVTEPRLAETLRRRLHLVYTRTIAGVSSVREAASDDDARTWNTETTTWASGTHPDIAVGWDGMLLRAAYVSGAIQATRQGTGDASASAVFHLKDSAAADLAVEDDGFRLIQDRRRIWWLHARISGEGKTSLWWSADQGATWTRDSDGITGGTKPSIACGYDGALLAWCCDTGKATFRRRMPGATSWEATASVQDSAAANLSITSDCASFAADPGRARLWLLVTTISGETALSDWHSGDFASTATRYS